MSEEKVCAIVICDDTSCTMSPITEKIPSCLFPVCGTPAIIYTLDWLITNNISEIFILFPDRPEYFIKDRIINDFRIMPSYRSKIQFFFVKEAKNISNYFRYLDKEKNKIDNGTTYVVVPGNLITNIDLSKIFDPVKGCHKNTKEGLLTIWTKNKFGHTTLAYTKRKKMITRFDDYTMETAFRAKDISLEKCIINDYGVFYIQSNLLDSSIHIMSGEIIVDIWKKCYQDANNYISKNLEQLQEIYIEIYEDAFCQKVDNLHCYINVTLSLINRSVYPVIVRNRTSDKDDLKEPYQCCKNFVYLAPDVYPGLSSILKNTIIESGTEISNGCIIENSVIGSNCTIGNNVQIENCIIWDDVKIGNGAVLRSSLVASGVTIRENVKIGFGNIIYFDCNIESDTPDLLRVVKKDEGIESEIVDFESQNDLAVMLGELKSKFEVSEECNYEQYIPSIKHFSAMLSWYFTVYPEKNIIKEDYADHRAKMCDYKQYENTELYLFCVDIYKKKFDDLMSRDDKIESKLQTFNTSCVNSLKFSVEDLYAKDKNLESKFKTLHHLLTICTTIGTYFKNNQTNDSISDVFTFLEGSVFRDIYIDLQIIYATDKDEIFYFLTDFFVDWVEICDGEGFGQEAFTCGVLTARSVFPEKMIYKALSFSKVNNDLSEEKKNMIENTQELIAFDGEEEEEEEEDDNPSSKFFSF